MRHSEGMRLARLPTQKRNKMTPNRLPEIQVVKTGSKKRYVLRFNDGSRSFRTRSVRAARAAVKAFVEQGVVTL